MKLGFIRNASLGLVLLGATAGSVFAHHSYVMFDRTKVATVKGSIAKVEWSDPHIWFWAYVANDKGGFDLYGFESGSINNLARTGWVKNTLKVGDKVMVTYNPLKDGRHGGFFISATFPDGTLTPPAGGAPPGEGQ